MKLLYTALLLLLIAPSYAQQEEIKWLTWDEMVEQRDKDSIKKKVFIDFYTPWCGWCKRLDQTTFKDPSVVSYMNSKYYPVKFNAETKDTIVFNGHTFINSNPAYQPKNPNGRGTAHYFAHSLLDGKLSYPSFALLDENLVRLTIYSGYKQPEPMIGILVFFGSDQYKYYHNYLNGIWRKSLQENQKP